MTGDQSSPPRRPCYRPAMSEFPTSLPRWQQLWLIEWQRQREGARPLDDPPAELAAWREAGEPQQRLLQRARYHLGASATPMTTALARLRWVLLVLLLMTMLAGASGAWALLGDPTRPINVLWIWLALLAPSLGLLLLWLLSLRGAAPAWAGDLLGRVLARLPALWPEAVAGQALFDLLRGQPGWRWWLGAASHALWLAALAGALAGVVLALALRRYDFVWETTILPGELFATLVHGLGWLPALVGFAQPDAAVVAASGDAPVAAARRLWSSWLLGALLVYGLLPRALALLYCVWRARRGAAALQLPLALPYYVELGERLAPPSLRLGVVDADASRPAALRLQPAAQGRGCAWLAIELPPAPPLAALATLPSQGVIDTAAQQRAAVSTLLRDPLAKLLVVVDATQSPDRAVLRQLVELGAGCVALAVLLQGADRDGRHAVWQRALADIGVAPSVVLDDAVAARAWLQAEDRR